MKFRIYDDMGEFCVADVEDYSDNTEALLNAVDELVTWSLDDEQAWELYDEDERDSHARELENFKNDVRLHVYDLQILGAILETSLGFTIEIIE